MSGLLIGITAALVFQTGVFVVYHLIRYICR